MKKGVFLVLILLVSVLFFFNILSVSATTYYVDSNITDIHPSSSTADCTTYDPAALVCGGGVASAYATVADASTKTLSSDDQMLFRKGQMWREQFSYPSSGTYGHPIIYGTFGTGASPIISASNLTTGWSKNTTNIWQATVTNQPYIVYFNGTRGTLVASVASITSEFSWFWVSNVLYVWSPTDSDPSSYYTNPGIEAGARNQAVRTNDQSYVTLDGITMRDGNQVSDNTVNIGSTNVTGIVFQNCVVERGNGDGFDIKGSSNPNNLTINNCTIRNNGEWGIIFDYQYTTANISNNSVYGNGWDSVRRNQQYSGIQGPLGNVNIFGNTIYNNTPIGCNQGGSFGNYCHGIYYNNQGNGSVPANIYNNTIYSNPGGDGIKLVGSANVYKNNIYGNAACGIEAGQNAAVNVTYLIYSNIIYANNLNASAQGICEQTKGAGTINLTINNNIVYKNSGTTQSEVKVNDNVTNLTIKNNIIWATNTRRSLDIEGNQTTSTLIDYNLQWSDTSGGDPGIRWLNTYPTWAQWKALSYDAHGLNLNPAFTNASGFMNQISDFIPQSTSPVINAGTNVGITTDFLGNAVPNGAAPDIGTFEYQSSGNSTNYYVNATSGNDSLAGTSPATAWKTIAKVNAASFSPGDNIYFERGDTWRETLAVPSAGNSTAQITFAAYGMGAQPIITGADNMTGFSNIGSNIWNKTSVSTQPNVVIVNGAAPIVMAANMTYVNASGTWFWNNSILSVYATSDPSGTIEAGQRNYSVDTNGKNYLTFSGLTIERGNIPSGSGGFYAHFNPSTIIITNCTITQNAANGIYINGLSPAFTVQYSTLSYNGMNGMGGNPYDNLLQNVLHNTINNNGWAAGSLSGFGSGFQGYANTGEFAYNIVYNNGLTGPDTTQHGFYFGQTNGTAAGLIVHDNEFYGHTMGAGIKSRGNITMYNNYIHNNEEGTDLGGNLANSAVYILHNNIITNANTALYELQKGTGSVALVAYNNVLYSSGNGGNGILNIADNLTALNFSNNIVAISSGNRIVWLGSLQTGTVNIDYNLYYQPSDSTPFRNVSTEINFTQWQALGYDAHGFNVDPVLSNGSGFMNQTSDFTLKSSSPAIDTGKNVSIITDFIGNSIPKGQGPDMGAYEYQSGGSGGSATYYVNATTGNDSNNGLSPGFPWKTIAKVNSATFSPGDKILFERGDTWREQLTVQNSGNATNQITFGSYGTGAAPVISGTDIFSSWTSEAFSHENFTDNSGIKPSSWWEFTELSGNRSDGNTSSNNTLVENDGTISRVAGPNTAVPYGVQFNYSASQSLNRSDSSLSAGFPGKFGVADQSVTFGAWVKVNSLGINQGVINKGSSSYFIFIASDGQVVVNGFTDGYGSFQEYFSTLSHVVTPGAWTHVVGRWNQSSGELALFMNGQFIGNTTLATMVEDTNPFTIGYVNYGGNAFLNGSIAEPFVFPSALSNSQISDIYASGLPGSSSTLYYATLSSDPQQVMEDGIRLAPVANKLSMTRGTFWFDSADSRVYIRTFEDADPTGHTVEVGARDDAIFMNGKSNISISNLTLHGGRQYGLYVYGQSSGLDVEGVTAEWNAQRGLWVAEPSATVTGVIIRNDTSRYNGGAGFDNSVDHWTGWLITNNTMNNNCQIITNSSGGPLDGGDGRNWCAGIKLFSLPQTGGVGTVVSYNNITNNGITGGTSNEGMGIWSDTTTGITIKYNSISGSIGPGINLEKTINNTVFGNVVSNSSLVFVNTARDSANEGGDIEITAGGGLNSSGNLILGNTVYGGWWGIGVNLEDLSATVKNNNITNNIAVGALGHNLFADTAGDNDGVYGSGNVYTYNSFGPESPGFIYWGANKNSYSDFDAAYGSSTHSVYGDPLLVNTSSGNLAIKAGSPAIDAGLNLGASYNLALNPLSSWPNNVSFLDQNSYGTGWDIGAYDYVSPSISLPFYTNLTNYRNTQSITYNISVTDIAGVTDSCVINVAGNANQTAKINSGWCNGTYSLTGLSDGNNIINAYANDTVGNFVLNNSFVVNINSIGRNYYVNATSGNDGNDGLSPSSPWQTIAKVNSFSFLPGDNVYFERGGTWREELDVPTSGNSSGQITFGAYGTGSNPVITAGSLVTGWTQGTGDVTTGLVSNWKLDENPVNNTSPIIDSKSGYNGTLTTNNGGTNKSASGIRGTAVNLDGSGDYISVANNANLNPGNITVSAWVKMPATSSTMSIISKDDGTANRVWDLRVNSGGGVQGIVWNATTLVGIWSTAGIADSNWHQVAMTWNGTTIQLYIDGVANGAPVQFLGPMVSGKTNSIYIGADQTSGITDIINGTIDDVRIYSRALNSTDISTLFYTGSNIYQAPVATQPSSIKIGSNFGLIKQSSAFQDTLLDVTKELNWFWVNSTLYIYSAGSDPVTKYGSVDVSSRPYVIRVNAKRYITFDGLTLDLSGTASFAGGPPWRAAPQILVDGSSSNITIKDSEFRYGYEGIIFDSAIGGNNIVYNNTFHDFHNTPILSYENNGSILGNETWIKDNKIYNVGLYGMVVNSNYWIIEGNEIYNIGQNPSPKPGFSQMTVGVEVYSNGSDNLGQNNTVRFNRIHDIISGDDEGTALESDLSTDYNSFYGNIAYNNDGAGMTIYGANHASVYGNTFYNNSLNSLGELSEKAEIKVIGKSGNLSGNYSIKNNIAVATGTNTYPIYIDSWSYNQSPDITNNIWYSNSTNWYFWNNSGGNDLSVYNSLTGVGTDINSDPLFNNSSNNDFTLQSTSPALDAGVSLGTPYNLELAPGSIWPNGVSNLDQNSYGSGWEVGAYVYQDSVFPTITIPIYTNKTSYQNSESLAFNLNVADDINVSSCSINVNGGTNQTLSAGSEWCNGTYSLSGLSDSYYVINAYANDTSGNTALNNSYSLQIYSSAAASTGSGGGGGGGSSTATTSWTTNNVSESDFEQGYTTQILPSTRLYVQIDSEDHYIGVVSISGGKAVILISSNPTQVTLSPGDNASVDVNNDNFYDIFVLLNGITNGQANLTVQKIHVPVAVAGNAVQTTGETQEQPTTTNTPAPKKSNITWAWVVALFIVLAAILFMILVIRRRVRKH